MTMTYVEIGVTDLGRAEAFYSGLLGLGPGQASEDAYGHRVAWLESGPAMVRLVEVGVGRASGWDSDDRQCGIRHFGLKVADIDAWAAKLADAGVSFALEPFDAFGNVRIAFFFDPDGAYLELVQGYVRHNNLWSPELAQQEVDGDRDWDGSPRFDHVAITVPNVDRAFDFYARQLGFGPVGQLVQPDEERGFLITNLRAGSGTLEVFSFDVPTHRRDGVGEPDRLGLRAIGVQAAQPSGDVVGPGDVPLWVER